MPGHSRRRRRAVFVIAAFIALVVVGIGVLHTPLGDHAARRLTMQLTVGDRPLNLLVIANNARNVSPNHPLGLGSAAGQADVLLVLHVDPMERGIWAITIPRDALVAQPGWHNPIPKIKTLFFMGDQETPPGGPELTMKAVSALTGMPIDGYLAINFAGFEEAVNFIGGLDVHVPERIYDPTYSHADFRPGLQHMNGAQALAFVRVRQNAAGNAYRVNDYQRMDAEVQVLSLLRAKLLDPKAVAFQLPRFVAHMRPDIATDLTEDRLVKLGFAMVGVPVTEVSIDSLNDSMTLASAHIPRVDADNSIEGASYDVLDPATVCGLLKRFGSKGCSTGLPSARPSAQVSVILYGTREMEKTLKKNGYKHIRLLGDSTGESRIVYPPADPASGWAIARILGGGGFAVEPGSIDTVAVTVYE